MLYQISTQTEVPTLLLNLSPEKLRIDRICVHKDTLFINSANTFYTLSGGKLTAKAKTKYPILKINPATEHLTFITPTRDFVFLNIMANQTL